MPPAGFGIVHRRDAFLTHPAHQVMETFSYCAALDDQIVLDGLSNTSAFQSFKAPRCSTDHLGYLDETIKTDEHRENC